MRGAAVKGDARPGDIVMRRRAEKNAGGIAERAGKAGKGGADRREAFDLGLVERMVRRVGAGEMAHHQVDAGLRNDRCRHIADAVPAQAEPIHAGIEVQRRRLVGAPAGPAGDLVAIAECRAQAKRPIKLAGIGKKAV